MALLKCAQKAFKSFSMTTLGFIKATDWFLSHQSVAFIILLLVMRVPVN